MAKKKAIASLLAATIALSAAVMAVFWLFPSTLDRAHVAWTRSLDVVTRPKSASLVFVGDMMFDRTMLTVAEEKGGDFLFACVADYLKGFDLAVGNMEGPITEHPSVSRRTVPGDAGNTTFTFPTSTAVLLKRNGIGAVSLANNHILDFGRDGARSTRGFLESAGVGYFGDPVDPAHKTFVTTVNGIKLALVGYNEFIGVDSVAGTVAEIQRVSALSDSVIVFSHWGDEYVSAVDRQRVAARSFVDAGADLVVGAHPHVIQEIETYKGTSIYYSLGNFIFDQYWKDEVRTGMAVEVRLSGKRLETVPRLVESTRASGPCLVPLEGID